MRYLILLSVLLLSYASMSEAETIHVPADYPSIKMGVEAAAPGDTVLVACGVYDEDVIRIIYGLCVRSETGDPECVEIRPYGWCFALPILIGPVYIEGVTVNGGYHFPVEGGAAWCDQGTVTFTDCIFRDFRPYGTVQCDDCSATFERCVFTGNMVTSMDYWAVLECGNAGVVLSGCFFQDNGAYGGCLCPTRQSIVSLSRCSLVENTGIVSSALWCFSGEVSLTACTLSHNGDPDACDNTVFLENGSHAMFENCILSFDHCDGAPIACEEGSVATLSCCDVYGNEGGDWTGCIADQSGIDGNICEDPLFCDPENGDFHLDCDSPCAPFTPPNEECDLIGAWPVGCGGTRAVSATWGGIKALFRSEASELK